MSFEIIKGGDLFDPAHKFNALAQGVNTKGLMGAGIAVPFRTKFPEMYREYIEWCVKYEAVLPGLLHAYYPKGADPQPETPAVYNLFSQKQPGKDGSYELLERATFLMLQEAEDAHGVYGEDWEDILEDNRFRVGLPWIGCGIAGLERHNVEHIFRRYLTDSDVEFVLVEQ
jgi:O-acetyl-ADP-ribose deacetylase (regulator of RNase III)